MATPTRCRSTATRRARVDGDTLWGLGVGRHEGRARRHARARPHASSSPRSTSPSCSTPREEVASKFNGLRDHRARAARPVGRRRRAAGRADGGSARGRLPGHDAPRGHAAREPGPHGAAVDGTQRHPPHGRAAGDPRRVRAAPAESSKDAIPRGLQAVFVEGGAAGNVVPDRARSPSTTASRPIARAAEAEAHVREVLRPVLETGRRLRSRRPRRRPPRPHLTIRWSRRCAVAATSRCGPSSGGPTSPSSPSGASPPPTSAPGDAEISHTRDERIERAYLTFAYAALADLLTHGVLTRCGRHARCAHAAPIRRYARPDTSLEDR